MALPDKARITLAVTVAGLTVMLFVFASPAAAAGPPQGRITATVSHPDDFLKGFSGNDRLNGASGRDVCQGGTWRDSISDNCETSS